MSYRFRAYIVINGKPECVYQTNKWQHAYGAIVDLREGHGQHHTHTPHWHWSPPK